MFFIIYGHSAYVYKEYFALFHLPLFYFISGILHKQTTTFATYFSKKIATLIVPYIILLVATTASAVLLYQVLHRPYPLYMSLLIRPYGVSITLWTFMALFFCCNIFQLILMYVKPVLGQVLVVASLFLISRYLSFKGIRLPLYLDSSFTILAFYAIGYWSGKHPSTVKGIIYAGALLAVIYYVWQAYIPPVHLMENIYPSLTCLFLSAALSFLVIDACKYLLTVPFIRYPLAFIGIRSLIFLGLHMLVFEFIHLVIPRGDPKYGLLATVLTIGIIALLDHVLGLQQKMQWIKKKVLNGISGFRESVLS